MCPPARDACAPFSKTGFTTIRYPQRERAATKKFPADRKTQRMLGALSVGFFNQLEKPLLFLLRFSFKLNNDPCFHPIYHAANLINWHSTSKLKNSGRPEEPATCRRYFSAMQYKNFRPRRKISLSTIASEASTSSSSLLLARISKLSAFLITTVMPSLLVR